MIIYERIHERVHIIIGDGVPVKRKSKKEVLNNQIVSSAKAIFREYGYEAATISMISKHACIGRGTIYNYYKSKADLFVTVVLENREAFRFNEKELKAEISETTQPLKTLQDLLISSITNYRDLSKKIWIDILGASISNQNDRGYLKKEITSFSRLIEENFEKVFEVFARHRMLPRGIDCKDASRCMHNIVVSETVSYLLFDNMTYEEYIENLRKAVAFTFHGKFIQKEKG